ncbi:type II secretion system protein, partial [Vibrio artabrorum]
LPPANDEAYKYEREATLSLFSKIPSIVFDEANNLITLRIDRPDKAFAYDGLVKRSGDDSTLLGDWDIGGLFGITNAKDVTLKASDGSQIAMSSLLSKSTTAKHGDWVKKPKCIQGQAPLANLSIASFDVDPRKYVILGDVKPYILSQTSTRWRVGMSIRVKIKSTGREAILTSGEVLLTASCR